MVAESGKAVNVDQKEKRRLAEKARRNTIRDLQDQISQYFLIPELRTISITELLLFSKFASPWSGRTVHLPNISVIVYLRIGSYAFPGLVWRLSRDREQ